MDYDKLDCIEPMLLPEDDILLERDDLYPTFWTDGLWECPFLHELEVQIDFGSIKHDLVNYKFKCNESFEYSPTIFSILSILYLADNSNYASYSIKNSILKMNIYGSILGSFYFGDSGVGYPKLMHNDDYYGMKIRGKGLVVDGYTESDYYDDLERMYLYELNYCMFGDVVGLFIWLKYVDEWPIVRVNNKVNIDHDKIKKIKVFGNHGFFVQLNTITLSQICSLSKYSSKIRDHIRETMVDWKRSMVEIVNYDKDSYVIDVLAI